MSFKTVTIDSALKPQSLNGLKVCLLNEARVVVLWHQRVVVIFHMSRPMEKLTKCYGVLQYTNDVKDVILSKCILLCLNKLGTIYITDLQDGNTRREGQDIEHKKFKFVEDVISITETLRGFLVITRKGELIDFKISRLENGKSKISQNLKLNLPENNGHELKDSSVLVCQSSDIDLSLASLLFKDIALLRCDIVFLGFNNGNTYWLPILDNTVDCKFNLIHTSTSAIVAIYFGVDGKSQQSNHILILFSNGSLAVIYQAEKQLKCKLHQLPSSVHCASLASPNVLFHSDGLNLWCSEVALGDDANMTFNTQLLHIKGVVALSYESGGNEVIAGCRHCILYAVGLPIPSEIFDNEAIAGRSESSGEIESLLTEWHKATQELHLLKEVMLTENKIMHEISTATRGEILRNMIRLTADVSDDFPFARKNTLALRVLNESSQEFSNEFWLFHIRVSSGNWNFSVTEKLEVSLKPKNTMIFVLPITALDLKFPVTVDSSLLLSVPLGDGSDEDSRQYHEIPMNRVFLSVIDFLMPVYENVSVNHQSLSAKDVPWEQFLARFNHISSVQNTTAGSQDAHILHCYSFSLPETESWSEFKDRLIKKPEHRLQLGTRHANKLNFRIRDSIITFTCSSDNQLVNIVTSNKYLLSEIQAFISHKVISGKIECQSETSVCIDEINYLKFRNINLALELDKERGTSWKNLIALKKELRSLFDLHIPELKN